MNFGSENELSQFVVINQILINQDPLLKDPLLSFSFLQSKKINYFICVPQPLVVLILSRLNVPRIFPIICVTDED